MVNQPYCLCGQLASYGASKYQDIPTHCVSCKDEYDMIEIFIYKCKCGKLASYGESIYQEKPTHCEQCKTTSMIHIRNRYCIYEDCKNTPIYGHLVSKPILLANCVQYCETHKQPNTYNLLKYTTVDSLRDSVCKYNTCEKRAQWGYTGPVRFIREGKFGYNYISIFCGDHRKEDMINIPGYIRRCRGIASSELKDLSECPYNNVGNPKCRVEYTINYNGKINVSSLRQFCTECFLRSFPDDSRNDKLKTKSKELRVQKMLQNEFPTYTFIHNKPIWTGECECTHRRRIDFRTLIGNTLLAVEVDEDQHKMYNEKEDIRYNDLYMVHSGKWIFIRYNPDSYKNEKGKLVKPADTYRLGILKDFIQTHIQRIQSEQNKELIEIHKLFFDAHAK